MIAAARNSCPDRALAQPNSAAITPNCSSAVSRKKTAISVQVRSHARSIVWT